MRINNIKTTNQNFKSMVGITRELDESVILSHAIVDMFGCTIPWIVMANNDVERKEKTRKYVFIYTIAWLSPFLTLPFSNRFAMKYIGKLTKRFWSNNHKAIHISNKFLKDKEAMMRELNKMSEQTTRSPLEILYNKLNPNKKYEQKLDIKSLLDNCGGDKELLRKKLIKAKNAVFISDCIFTFGSYGMISFVNNEITKKKTGQSGFSAEMSMADKEIVEKRAKDYENKKRKRCLTFLSILSLTTLAMSLMAFGSIYSKSTNKFICHLRNKAENFDYKKGIYMSRLPMFIGSLLNTTGQMLGARNNTERKDSFTRGVTSDTIFYGGDLLITSLLANISDRLFGTKLRKENNNSLFRKIFPEIKSVSTIVDEVKAGKLSKFNQNASIGIFWASMIILTGSMGYFLPKMLNKMIKKDVEEDVQKETKHKQYIKLQGQVEQF